MLCANVTSLSSPRGKKLSKTLKPCLMPVGRRPVVTELIKFAYEVSELIQCAQEVSELSHFA